MRGIFSGTAGGGARRMKKACINCAYASEFYPSFIDRCDLDSHVIADADEYSCKNFYPIPEEDDDGKSKLD